jgi:hypothetical protein
VQQTIITPSRQRFGSICCCRCCSGLRPRMTGSSRTQFDAFVFLSAAPAPVPGGVSQESSQDCRAGDKKFRQDSSLHRPLLRGIWVSSSTTPPAESIWHCESECYILSLSADGQWRIICTRVPLLSGVCRRLADSDLPWNTQALCWLSY